MKMLKRFAVQTIWLAFAVNLAISTPVCAQVELDDIPAIFREGFDPNRLAFAYYDYRLTTGFEGQFTSFTEGPLSLFDETQSGISLVNDFSWVPGTGWVSTGSDKTYHWKNIRVEENFKRFFQVITLDPGANVTDVTITTDNPQDQITGRMNAVTNESEVDINGDGDTNDRVLVIGARISPQPNDVFVKVTFNGTIVEQGWVLDQCEPIPEPSTLALLGTGTLGMLGFGWRRRKQAS